MPLHRLRFYLLLVLVCLVVAAIKVLIWGAWFSPIPVTKGGSNLKSNSAPASDQKNLPTLESFEKVWKRPMRRSLSDATPKATTSTTQTPPRPQLSLQLIGTIADIDGTAAILANAQGQQEIRRVGDKVGGDHSGVEVREITAHKVVLDNRGEQVTLSMLQPPTAEELMREARP